MAAAYFSPVKALMSPMPKMLKSLLPKREEKKDKSISSLSEPQVRNRPYALLCIDIPFSFAYPTNLFTVYGDEPPSHCKPGIFMPD